MAKYQFNEDYLFSKKNAPIPNSTVTQQFYKGDVIDGIIYEAGTVTTNLDGTIPNNRFMVIGKVFAEIPLTKLTKVGDETPVKVSRDLTIPLYVQDKEKDEKMLFGLTYNQMFLIVLGIGVVYLISKEN
jgi:hypothetical protein